MNLPQLGWTPYFAEQHQALFPNHVPGRVCAEFREAYRLISPTGEFAAKIDGKLRHGAVARSDYPAVGDWVVYSPLDPDNAVIHAVLPRKNCVLRRAAGTAVTEQIIAANVDSMFLMSALNADFNVRRIERYVALARESQTQPVIVLNKADLCRDLVEKLDELDALALNIPVHVIAAIHNDGVATLAPYMSLGHTIAVVGSSGVGKSTLINALLERTH